MRLAIMSFAHIHAESYIENLRRLPGVEFIGFADDDPARGDHFAHQYGATLFRSYEELLAARPDGVIICSENSYHKRLTLMAAEAGVHVLCEKPLATTADDARAMIDACQRAGVVLMTAFPMRFNAPVLEIKSLLDSGRLGNLHGLKTTNQGRCPNNLRGWFVDKQLAGGGAVFDHTVHLADLMRWFLKSEVVEVYAQTNQILYGDEVDVETGGLLLLTFANGVFASIDCSWNKPRYYPTWGGLTMELVGTGGLARMDAFRQNLTVYTHQEQRPQWAFWGSDADLGMIAEFITAIQEKRPPLITGVDGLRATEIALAAYRSAQSGQPEKV